MRDDAPRLAPQIRDNSLVVHIQDTRRRQHAAPVPHECLIGPVVAAELRQVVGVILTRRKKLRKAGLGDIGRIAHRMNDACIGRRQVNKANEGEVRRRFVDDTRRGWCQCADFSHVAGAQLPKMIARAWKQQRPDVFYGIARIRSPARKIRGWLATICSIKSLPERASR